MAKLVSFDRNPDFYSGQAKLSGEQGSAPSLHEMLEDASDEDRNSFIYAWNRLTSVLPMIDQEILKLYDLQGLTQEQIAGFMGISPSAISLRIKASKLIMKRLLERPSNNPVEVRTDLKKMLPERLVEAAFFFYFEIQQSRVMHFLSNSQPGARNKLNDTLKHLDGLYKSLIIKEFPDSEYVKLVLSYKVYLSSITSMGRFMRSSFRDKDGRKQDYLIKGISILEGD